MEIISCEGVSFSYPKTEYLVLNDISFSIEQGEFCLIIGKSAAGKTTLLKLLKKEIAPAGELKGKINCNGNVGYVAQNVEENIVCDKVRSELSFGLSNMGLDSASIRLKVAEIAGYFNLSEKLEYDVSQLSGGEKQILNLASVMIMEPDILVLDEPTCQLDPVWAERFLNIIKKLHRDFGTTIILSEHLLEDIFPYAKRVLLIEDGTITKNAQPLEMIDYLRSNKNDMIRSIPVSMTLFEGALTLAQCREMLLKKSLQPLSDDSLDGDVILDVKNVYFAYENNRDVLKDLSLKIYKNKINVILGANSSGKSTFLKVISGVLKQHHGKVKASGKISMLCQNPRDLFTKERCADEVTFGEVTNFLEIDNIKNSHPYDISGGEAQRLALAKVLETKADILLLDEPTKALDSAFKDKLGSKLNDICNMGKTIVITTHDVDFAGDFGEVISFLSNGEIITTLPKREFFSSMNFYTTSLSKITKGIAPTYISYLDLIKGGIDE